MRIEPERLVCAYHRAHQQQRPSRPEAWDAFPWLLPPPTFEALLPPLRTIYETENSYDPARELQSVTPEDVRPGYEMGTLKKVMKTVDTVYDSLEIGHDVKEATDEYVPWGRVLAVFHHYGRREPILYALSDGACKGVAASVTVQTRAASVPVGDCSACGTEQTAAWLVWLLRRLYGAATPLTVRPRAVEEAIEVADAWRLIRRGGSGEWGMAITDAGKIWLLAHCREQGEELDHTAAERRAIQNIIDARGAQGMNVNQGNVNQGNVNFGTQGDVNQGNRGPIAVRAGTDVAVLSQALDLIAQNHQQLNLSLEQTGQLWQALTEMRTSIEQGNPHAPAAARAGRTVLALGKDVLVKAGTDIMLTMLQRVAGIG